MEQLAHLVTTTTKPVRREALSIVRERGAGRGGGMVTTARLGHLQHGNPAGDPSTAPRCGAQTRSGQKCRAPAMRNPKTGQSTRCRMHGGASTGPQTPEGLERCRKARWKHGHRSAAAVAERRRRAQAGRKVRAELSRLEELLRSLRG